MPGKINILVKRVCPTIGYSKAYFIADGNKLFHNFLNIPFLRLIEF